MTREAVSPWISKNLSMYDCKSPSGFGGWMMGNGTDSR